MASTCAIHSSFPFSYVRKSKSFLSMFITHSSWWTLSREPSFSAWRVAALAEAKTADFRRRPYDFWQHPSNSRNDRRWLDKSLSRKLRRNNGINRANFHVVELDVKVGRSCMVSKGTASHLAGEISTRRTALLLTLSSTITKDELSYQSWM